MKKDDKKKKKDPLLEDIEKLSNMEKELKEATDQLKNSEETIKNLTETQTRTLADLQNYRRRTEQEKVEFVKYANVELIKEILPIVDIFTKSLDFIPEDVKKENWCQGIVQTIHHLRDTLKKQGVEEINCLGEKIDPNLHDAVLQGSGKKDIIIEILEKGYKYNDKIIKHVKVKVGNGEKS